MLNGYKRCSVKGDHRDDWKSGMAAELTPEQKDTLFDRLIHDGSIDEFMETSDGTPYSLDITDQHGNTPLHYAVLQEHSENVQKLLDHGANIEYMGTKGETALHLAVQAEDYDMTEMLLKAGADVSALTTPRKLTPLHYAAHEHSHCAIIHLLLRYGAKTDIQSHRLKRTPQHIAANMGKNTALAFMLQYSAPTDLLDAKGDTVLHHATISHDSDTVSLLLSKGVNPNTQNHAGSTPLHFAVITDNVVMVNELLCYNAILDVYDAEGDTAVHVAAMRGNTKIMRKLLQFGGSVSAPDWYGNTPLHLATAMLRKEMVRYLLDLMVDINVTNEKGRLPRKCGLDDTSNMSAQQRSDIIEIQDMIDKEEERRATNFLEFAVACLHNKTRSIDFSDDVARIIQHEVAK